MKFLKLFLAAVAAAGLATAAVAQELWGGTRNIVVTSPTVLITANPLVTNGPVDIHGYIGRALLDIYSCTNAGGALTVTVQSSPDNTNWTTLTNFALITSTTQILYTNGYYGGGTGMVVSNNYLLPGTVTSATAGNSSNSFAGQTWLNYSTVPFTNSGSVTVTAKGTYQIGFPVNDLTGRYLQVYWTPSGGSGTTNDIVAATLIGMRETEVQ